MSAPTTSENAAPAGPAADGPTSGPGRRAAPRRRSRVRQGLGRWSLDRILAVTGAALAVLLVIATIIGAVGLSALDDRRVELVDQIGPALVAAQQLDAATVDQETGIRGYALARTPDFLVPYEQGRAEEARLIGTIRALETSQPEALADLAAVEAATANWRAVYAEPTVDAMARGTPPPSPEAGKAAFDQVRDALDVQRGRLLALRDESRAALGGAATTLTVLGVVTVLGLAAGVAVLLLWLRRIVVAPTHRLAREVREVADGDLEHHIVAAGPQEITELAEDVEAMRVLIVRELADTEQARQELARSNSDLEQFAYVASHDLQEPLRKVASFCQLLQRRYAGQLDERADQYIEFASDGAKRMQVLINDLLAFSRVGRQGDSMEVVDLDRLVDRATENVAGALEESGAVVEHGRLPSVLGAPALLTTVFQNLLGNSLKFRGDEPPRLRVDAERDPEDPGRWLLRFRDNGIGIDAEYAERIFVIFQRLHPRNAYPGTGIGLAMCRKIVEHHGGAMWLEPHAPPGTTFVVALPALTESTGPAEESP